MKTYMQSHWTHEGFRPLRGDDLRCLLVKVHGDIGPCVIVDGSDDYGAPSEASPNKLARDFGLTPQAKFQSGVSGQNNSGLVFTPEEYALFVRAYEKHLGVPLSTHLRVIDLTHGVSLEALSVGETFLSSRTRPYNPKPSF